MACRVGDQVFGTLVSLDEAATVMAAAERMAAEKVGSLVVTRGDQVVGLFTEQDLLRRVVAAGDPRWRRLARRSPRGAPAARRAPA